MGASFPEGQYYMIWYIAGNYEQEFISDFDTLPLNIVYPSDDPEEQLEYFNSMFKEFLERHAPLQRGARCEAANPG